MSKTEGFDANTGNFEETDRATMRDKLYDATSRIKDKAADMGRAASGKFEETRDSAASALNNTASQVREGGRGMANEKLGKVAATVADGLERTSTYLRPGGMSEVCHDVEGLVKSHPTETILGALAVGFLLGKTITRR